MLKLGNTIWNSSKKHYQKKSYWSNLEYVWRCAADAKVERMYAVFIKQQIRYSTCGHWKLKKEGGDFEQSWELRTRVNQTGFFDV